MTYRGIDRCDACGRLLEQGQWLSGLCKRCEKAAREREVEILKSKKGLL